MRCPAVLTVFVVSANKQILAGENKTIKMVWQCFYNAIIGLVSMLQLELGPKHSCALKTAASIADSC